MWKDPWLRYETFQRPKRKGRLFRHSDLSEEISHLRKSDRFRISVAGQSVRGKDIYHIVTGKGPIPVLLWSQMHGNESTGTRAFFDFFSFLDARTENLEPWKSKILERLTLHFIPMLNPDGAEKWQRENELGIDLNRDALKRTAPESQILSKIHALIRPRFGFNMHDQSVYYAAGNSLKPASITLMAPPCDPDDSLSPARLKALKVSVMIKNNLSALIPGQIARWKDDYEPRAFGETFQGLGTSTILVETGGFPGDEEKNFLSRLTGFLLLESLYQIASNQYMEAEINEYFNIPLNRENGMFDRIERNRQCITAGYSYIADLGYRKKEIFDGNAIQTQDMLEATGDLSLFGSYQECYPLIP